MLADTPPGGRFQTYDAPAQNLNGTFVAEKPSEKPESPAKVADGDAGELYAELEVMRSKYSRMKHKYMRQIHIHSEVNKALLSLERDECSISDVSSIASSGDIRELVVQPWLNQNGSIKKIGAGAGASSSWVAHLLSPQPSRSHLSGSMLMPPGSWFAGDVSEISVRHTDLSSGTVIADSSVGRREHPPFHVFSPPFVAFLHSANRRPSSKKTAVRPGQLRALPSAIPMPAC